MISMGKKSFWERNKAHLLMEKNSVVLKCMVLFVGTCKTKKMIKVGYRSLKRLHEKGTAWKWIWIEKHRIYNVRILNVIFKRCAQNSEETGWAHGIKTGTNVGN